MKTRVQLLAVVLLAAACPMVANCDSVLQVSAPENVRVDYEVTQTLFEKDSGSVESMTSSILSVRKFQEHLAVAMLENLPERSVVPELQKALSGWFFRGDHFLGHQAGGLFMIEHDRNVIPPTFLGELTFSHGISMAKRDGNWIASSMSFATGGDHGWSPVEGMPDSWVRPGRETMTFSWGNLESRQVIVLSEDGTSLVSSVILHTYHLPEESVEVPFRRVIATQFLDGRAVEFEITNFSMPARGSDMLVSLLDLQERANTGDNSAVASHFRLREVFRGETSIEEASLESIANDIRMVRAEQNSAIVPVAGLKMGEPYDGPRAAFDSDALQFIIQ